MESPKYTLAPWIKEKTVSNPVRNHFRSVIHSETNNHYVTVCDVFGETEEECKSNMQLISAAPDLLEVALLLNKAATMKLPTDFIHFMAANNVYKKAENAINKALNQQ